MMSALSSLPALLPGLAASPGSTLTSLSLLSTFLLEVTIGYGLCWAIARFIVSAPWRFAIWLGFLLCASAAWLLCLREIVFPHTVGIAPTGHASAAHLSVVLSSGSAAMAGRVLLLGLASYALAVVVLASVEVAKRLMLQRALRFRKLPGEPLRASCTRLAGEMAAPKCALWLLPGLSSPASLGWLRPAVYLPMDEAGREPEQLRDILVHELGHLRRRDWLWEMLARACRTLLFFHPCAHAAVAALRLERELACDALVVRRNPAKRDLYADTLVRFGWKTSIAANADGIGIGFTSRARVLHARVQAILAGERAHSRVSTALRAMLGTGVCWVFIVIAPALWVGFSLAAPQQHVAAAPAVSAEQTLTASHLAISLRPHARNSVEDAEDGETGQKAEQSPGPHPGFVQPERERRATGFHVQNEEESMFTPHEVSTSAGAPEGTGPGVSSNARRVLPSAESVAATAVNVAVQLSRMGGSRDHDHD